VLERGGGAGFVEKALAGARIGGEPVRQELERDTPLEPEIQGQVDGPHATLAEELQDLITGDARGVAIHLS
jgi:hypothetical protein